MTKREILISNEFMKNAGKSARKFILDKAEEVGGQRLREKVSGELAQLQWIIY